MRWSWAYLGVAAAVVVGAYFFGRRDGRVTEQERRWADSAQAALKDKTLKRELAAARDSVTTAQAQARQAAAATNKAVQAQDSLGREIGLLKGDTAGMTDPEHRAIHFQQLYEKRTQQQMQTVAALTSRTQERDLALDQVGVLTRSLGAAEARVAQLEGLLDRGVKLQKCRIAGLVPCPSREAAFVGGVLLGIGLHAAS